MKKIILAVSLFAFVGALNAQDTTKMKKKMMKTDTMHHKMMKSKMKKDSTK